MNTFLWVNFFMCIFEIYSVCMGCKFLSFPLFIYLYIRYFAEIPHNTVSWIISRKFLLYIRAIKTPLGTLLETIDLLNMVSLKTFEMYYLVSFYNFLHSKYACKTLPSINRVYETMTIGAILYLLLLITKYYGYTPPNKIFVFLINSNSRGFLLE